MKLLFLVGGIAFLLLGLLLVVAAVVMFMIGRNRAAKQSAAMQPVPVAAGPVQAPAQILTPDPPWVPPSPPEVPSSWLEPPAEQEPPVNAWMETPVVPSTPSWVESTPLPPEPPPEPPPVQAGVSNAGSTQAYQVTTPAFAPDATVAVPMPEPESWGALHATSGPLAGRSFPVTREGFVIGRDPGSAQVVIPDSSVSKRHVWVGVRDEEVIVVDEGSTNGTYLNVIGARITRQVLTPGDTLIISNDITRLDYQR